MSRKSKINPIEKVKIVERYLRGEIGMRQAGKELGIAYQSKDGFKYGTPLINTYAIRKISTANVITAERSTKSITRNENGVRLYDFNFCPKVT